MTTLVEHDIVEELLALLAAHLDEQDADEDELPEAQAAREQCEQDAAHRLGITIDALRRRVAELREQR